MCSDVAVCGGILFLLELGILLVVSSGSVWVVDRFWLHIVSIGHVRGHSGFDVMQVVSGGIVQWEFGSDVAVDVCDVSDWDVQWSGRSDVAVDMSSVSSGDVCVVGGDVVVCVVSVGHVQCFESSAVCVVMSSRFVW